MMKRAESMRRVGVDGVYGVDCDSGTETETDEVEIGSVVDTVDVIDKIEHGTIDSEDKEGMI